MTPVHDDPDLRKALMRARATELAELRQMERNLAAYGDRGWAATRSDMIDEAKLRILALDRALGDAPSEGTT